ncbi:MAG TPA: ATP-binding protein [Planctomycetota bacterium]|nr:ATP-binding protein [Planctomycetota bacterium]
MNLPFLDREAELARLRAALSGKGAGFACVYGRRRLGKSALLRRLLSEMPAVYYVGDDREAALQRSSLASEVARHLPGFDQVDYRDWERLLARWWQDAPPKLALILDEFPAMVTASPELPSLLQKQLDHAPRPLVLCGSSQRMMHGLVLDASAPLFGRAREILRLEPLTLPWLRPALGLRRAADAIEHYAVWGGVPRYWELAAEHPSRAVAVAKLVLDPLGVLHREPDRLLQDDIQDTARSASILALIGAGCHRLTEIAARLGVPATTLSRPVARLLDLGLVERTVPFGRTVRDTKRTLYRLRDPFLAFWYRFVEPNRSRLAVGQLDAVAAEVERDWPVYLGMAWEQMARDSVAQLEIAGDRWRPALRWWGASTERTPIEIDVVAESVGDRRKVLVGEAKLTATAKEVRGIAERLARDAARCPELLGRRVSVAVWVLRVARPPADVEVITADRLWR